MGLDGIKFRGSRVVAPEGPLRPIRPVIGEDLESFQIEVEGRGHLFRRGPSAPQWGQEASEPASMASKAIGCGQLLHWHFTSIGPSCCAPGNRGGYKSHSEYCSAQRAAILIPIRGAECMQVVSYRQCWS